MTRPYLHLPSVLHSLFKSLFKRRSRHSPGLSMIETIIVITIVAILILLAILGMYTYLARGRDARRKSDLEKIKVAFEEYYNDNGCYPPSTILNNCGGAELQPYLASIPCDPGTGDPYLYVPHPDSLCSGYRVLTDLEYDADPVIGALNCSGPTWCGFGDGYDYGIAAGLPVANDGNTPIPSPTPSVVPGFDGPYACAPAGAGCNDYGCVASAQAAGCPNSYADPACGSECNNPANECSGPGNIALCTP